MALATLGNGWLPRIERVLAAFHAEHPEPAGLRAALCRFLDLVVTWNQRMDLTAARDADELVDLMLADAVLIARESFEGSQRPGSEDWLDVGSGAGAPGLPLALLLPKVRFRMVEPRQKRVAFLRTSLSTLGVTGASVERCRSSELGPKLADVAVSRATLPPDEWLREGARLSRGRVWVLLARGSPPTLQGWRCDRDLDYAWPLTGAGRRAVRYVQQP